MSINEVFPNPTVKQVIFQIIFPNLFYIENKIGELQVELMEKFPQSALIHRRPVLFADIGSEVKLSDITVDLDKEAWRKIWEFRSPKDFELHVLSDSLDISSRHHKTYKLREADRFRDIIKFVLDPFFKLTGIPVVNRIGLRYIDECPIPAKEDDRFRSYYNSVFPLDRFSLSDVDEMDFKTKVRRGKYHLRYIESLRKIKGEYKLIIDSDGFAEDIASKDYLKVTDKLHKIITDEYERTIKGPVYKYMRRKKKEQK